MIPFGSWKQYRKSRWEQTKNVGVLGIFGVIYKHEPRQNQIQNKLLGEIKEFNGDLNIGKWWTYMQGQA